MRRFLGLIVAVASLAGLAQPPQGVVPEQGPVLAVAPFVDASGSGLLGVEGGLADMLEEKLQQAGYPVIPHQALESWLVGQGIWERTPAVFAQAAAAMGAEYLLLGALEGLNTARVSLSFGFFTVEGVSATARVSLDVYVPATGDKLASLEAEGSGRGEATASFRLFLSLPWDVCLGGLRTSKHTYLYGEPVVIGYLDPTPPGTYYVTIQEAMPPSPVWISPRRSSSAADPCVSWTWNQWFGGSHADPGLYTVSLYEVGNPVPIAMANFQISPEPAGWAIELQVGTPEFSGTAWNQAISAALDELVSRLSTLWAGVEA